MADDSVYQDKNILTGEADSIHHNQNDVTSEDVGKEDMFVDCPEELTPNDGKNTPVLGNKEAAEVSETQQNLEEKDGTLETRVNESTSDAHSNNDVIDEIEQLRALLATSVTEKENYAREYEEERRSYRKEFANLHHQLITLTQPESSLYGIREGDKEGFLSDSPLDEMAKICSDLIKQALDQRSEIQAILSSKDQEIENLNAKVSEILVSNDGLLASLSSAESHLTQQISRLEGQHGEVMQQLEKEREKQNAEIQKLRVEIEQEKTRSSNTKEKLSLAVTKGKALVQQRDSLKQAVAEKTSELEKCLVELQEKSTALKASELRNEELIMLEDSLKQSLAEKTIEAEKCLIELQEKSTTLEDLIQQENLLKQSLAEKTGDLEKCLAELQEKSAFSEELVKSQTFTASLQEALSQRDAMLETCNEILSQARSTEDLQSIGLAETIRWLVESFHLAKDEAIKLQNEIAQTNEAAQNAIDLLTSSLLAETLEKSYLLEEFEDLKEKLDLSVGKEHQVSKEKEQYRDSERIQSLLYVVQVESSFYEQILEEEMMFKTELIMVSQELNAVKEEKVALQNYLERSEEKAALLREKLSMAVKKGKGLVQERENLKQSLKENSDVIEKLKLELEQKVSEISSCSDQISKLSADLERIPKLETDFVEMKEQRDNLERYLLESNGMLQRVIEAIEDIDLPVDSEEPVEKIKGIAGYLSEVEFAKKQVEQDLEKIKEDATSLASNLENNIAKLEEEKRELEISKAHVEKDLERSMGEVTAQLSKLDDVSTSKKSLEDALLLAERNISLLVNEKEAAQASRAAAEMEVQRLKEEVSIHTSKLSESQKFIQSLEDRVSQVQANISMLTEENNNAQVNRGNLESEIKKLKEDADTHASRLADASSTIKSLEDTVSSLLDEKSNYEREISTLNSRLNACLEELSGTHGNLENRSLELSSHFHSLQLLLKDDTLFSLLTQNFDKQIRCLKDLDDLLRDIWGHFVEIDSDILQNCPQNKENFFAPNLFEANLDKLVNVEMVNGEVDAVDGDGVMSYIRKTVEEIGSRDKVLAAKFQSFSTFMDELIAALFTNLHATKDQMLVVLDSSKSAKQSLTNMEQMKDAQEKTIEILENSIAILASACTEATRELDAEVENRLVELDSTPELDKVNHESSTDDNVDDSIKYVKTTKNLLSATVNVRNLIQMLQDSRRTMTITIKDLEGRVQETTTKHERAVEDMGLAENKVSKLETELEDLHNLCSEMRVNLETYRAQEDRLNQREAELAATLKKEHVDEEALLSATQIKSLIDKIQGIEIPSKESEEQDVESNNSVHVRKLFYIIDSVNTLQHQMTLLSREKENLHSTIEDQVLEIEHLKAEAEEHISNRQEYEKVKKELFELGVSLENIIQKLGGDESVGNDKSGGILGLVPVLEKLVMAVNTESENLKYKSQELGGKLVGTQKIVDDLSSKVKLLEEIKHNKRDPSPEAIRDRGGFESSSLSTRSEISEIEDVGPVGKKVPPAAPSAAHVRTLRKGSSDHLAINVDSESDRLIEETTEDKGHLFKSLNTSGLVPRQGKIMADRIDGIWVSGGRALMSRPRARLGVIAYWLILHLWLVGTIL